MSTDAWVPVRGAIEQFANALREKLEPAMRTAARAIANMAAVWQLIPPRDRLRILLGSRNWVPETGEWQSDMCGAWLHGSCRSPHLTECCCTCHGGSMR